jgi:hypothetical protein
MHRRGHTKLARSLACRLALASGMLAAEAVAQTPERGTLESESPESETPETSIAPAAPSAPPAPPQMPPGSAPSDSFFAPEEGLRFSEFESLSSPSEEPEGPRLDIYGFMDFTYFHVLADDESTWPELLQPNPSFYVGHVNVYFNSKISTLWRSLLEVRFTYLPQGKETINPDGTTTLFDATGPDRTEGNVSLPWGGINLERAWLEYEPYASLAIRAGSWLTPYGFYNDDHGTPTILSLHRPFIIADQPFPERQAGLHVHGKVAVGWLDFGYDVTLSNGRGPLDQFNDWDTNKALGGRLSLDARQVGELHLGVAAYTGRYTAARRRYSLIVVDEQPALDVQTQVDTSYRELSLGGEARYRLDGFMIQGEIMMNEAVYDEGKRAPLQELTSREAFAADYRRWGYYVLTGYTLPWLNLTPFVLHEYYNYTNWSILPPVVTLSTGVNLRPTPGVTLKASFMTAIFSGRGSTGFGNDPGRFIAAQAAWAF